AAPTAPAPQGSAVEQVLNSVNGLSQLNQLSTLTDAPGQLTAPATDPLTTLTGSVTGLTSTVQP
ncbi:hypothetical protein, partial [Streptomyces clavuligerus]